MVHHKKIKEILENNEMTPIPLNLFTEQMGLNMVEINSISWQEKDNRIINLTIYFSPTVIVNEPEL